METLKLTILTASSGKYLTNGEIICTSVQLAPSANAADWWEIDEYEKRQMEAAQVLDEEPTDDAH